MQRYCGYRVKHESFDGANKERERKRQAFGAKNFSLRGDECSALDSINATRVWAYVMPSTVYPISITIYDCINARISCPWGSVSLHLSQVEPDTFSIPRAHVSRKAERDTVGTTGIRSRN